MADDVKLLAVIDARTKGFENALKRIERQTNATFGKADQSVRRLESSINSSSASLLRFGRTFATAFGAGIVTGGLVALPGIIRDVVKSMADLGDTAERIGLTTDRLQELNFQAQQTGSSAETMGTALETLGKRIGEAAIKGGDLAKLFEANGIALRDATGNLKPFNTLLDEFINLIRGVGSESERLAIAALGFGRGAGAEMALTFRDGTDGARAFKDMAHDTSQVLNNELIESARKIDDQFDQLAGTLATFAQEQVLIFVRDLVQAFNDLSTTVQAVKNVASGGISLGASADDVEEVKKQLAEAESALATLQRQALEGLELPADSITNAITLVEILRGELNKLQSGAVQAAGLLKAERTKDDLIIKPTVLPTPPPGRTGSGGSRTGGGGGGGVNDIERQKKAVVELIAELQRELTLVGASDAQRRISNELRQAGAEATAEQKAQITALVTQIEAEGEAQERLIDTLDGIRNAAGSALDSFAQSIQDGEGAAAGLKAALVDVLQTIIRIGEQQAIASLFGGFGQGGGGLLGGLIGGLLGSSTGGGGPALGSLTAASASVTGGRTGAPVIQLSVVPGQMFVPVVERISGNVSVRHAASAETRAVARTPASARDNQRRFAIP